MSPPSPSPISYLVPGTAAERRGQPDLPTATLTSRPPHKTGTSVPASWPSSPLATRGWNRCGNHDRFHFPPAYPAARAGRARLSSAACPHRREHLPPAPFCFACRNICLQACCNATKRTEQPFYRHTRGIRMPPKTPKGAAHDWSSPHTPQVVARELVELGYQGVEPSKAGVAFRQGQGCGRGCACGCGCVCVCVCCCSYGSGRFVVRQSGLGGHGAVDCTEVRPPYSSSRAWVARFGGAPSMATCPNVSNHERCRVAGAGAAAWLMATPLTSGSGAPSGCLCCWRKGSWALTRGSACAVARR